MRLIDADALHFSYVEETSAPGWMHCVVRSLEIKETPTIDAEPVIRCKDCKYFELDHFENVSGVPLIVGHEICTKWGDGCKTDSNGYCFMAERREE